ncbi:MAG: ester cyclase [Pseudomonadota bacterium]
METAKKALATGALIVSVAVSGASAQNAETASAFYDLLSNPSSEERVAAFIQATSETWESIGNYSGENESRDAFLGQIGGFAELIPDLDWAIQDIHEDGNFVTVRSRATGTPVAPFFGVDGQGRNFDIMTIDIHEFADGVIVRSYHVEDWASALQQLAGR